MHLAKFVLIVGFGSFIWSCSKRENTLIYEDGKQQFSVNLTNEFGEPLDSVWVIRTGEDTVKSGETANFRMRLSSDKYQILDAYFNCKVNSKTLIDTTTFKIQNCTERVPIREGMVIIQFTAGVPGLHGFPDLVLTSRDESHVFRYHEVSFDYFAID